MTEYRSLLERAGTQAPAPDLPLERVLRRRDRRRRNQRIAAGAVGFAVFVAAIWVVTTGGPFDRTSTPGGGTGVTGPTGSGDAPPHPLGVGLLDFPPEGATPSTPERGELVVSFLFGHSPGDPGRFGLDVYADGRVIWQRLGLEGVSNRSTGLIEQRLTPEGVQLVLAEVLSTGLLDRDRELVGPDGLYYGEIRARVGGRLVSLTWGGVGPSGGDPIETRPTPEQVRAIERLDTRLEDLGSWLPASAWADAEYRAYVPSRYQVCYGGLEQALERSFLLDLLPTPVEDVLRPLETSSDELHGPFGPITYWCSTVTTDQARELAGILEDAGASRHDPDWPSYVFAPTGGPEIDINFDPVVPQYHERQGS